MRELVSREIGERDSSAPVSPVLASPAPASPVSASSVSASPVLVRVHSHCLAGDVFGASWCDCRQIVARSMEMIEQQGRGALIYLHQTGRGFAIEKVDGKNVLAFHRETNRESAREGGSGSSREIRREGGENATPEHQRKTQRDIGIGAQILSDLGLHEVRLLTNHPKRVAGLEGFGIQIVEQVPVPLDDRHSDRSAESTNKRL